MTTLVKTIKLSPKMITVYCEHERLFGKLLKRFCDMTVTEYCVLREINLAGGRVEGFDFAGFLMLKHSTISMTLSSLENKGYIKRELSSTDRRMLSVSATQKGVQAGEEATQTIHTTWEKTFWSNFDLDEERGGHRIAYLVLTKLRGYAPEEPAVPKENVNPISPEFIMFLKLVPQRWSQVIKNSAGLSLSEYRVLFEMAEAGGSTLAADLSRRLYLDRSMISVCKDKLLKRGLLFETPDDHDRRNSKLKLTAEGKKLCTRLTDELQAATEDMFSLCLPKYTKEINIWNDKLYDNMGTLSRVV